MTIVARSTKTLSATDLSVASTHQDGILIPKKEAEGSGVFPPLDTNESAPEEGMAVLSGADGSDHIVRFVYYKTKREYRLTWTRALLKSLGQASTGDSLTLEVDDSGVVTAHIRSPHHAWLALSRDGSRTGDLVSVDSRYVWDSTVAHHEDLKVGDRIVLWDGQSLLGFSVIEAIETERRGNHIEYRSRHDAAWTDAADKLTSGQLEQLSEPSGSDQQIRRLEWTQFSAALTSVGMEAESEAVDERAASAHGGHRTIRVRVRVGQGRFRAETLDRHGLTCAFTGSAPADVLEAAHLYSFALVGAHLDHGGLPLRADIHRLFDRGLITVSPTTLCIDVHESLSSYPAYQNMDGHPLHLSLTEAQVQWLRVHRHQHIGAFASG